MAEATNDEVEILICCICDYECIGPRKLPGCGHTFCETCVLIRVTELKDKDVLVNGFPCPSCEVVSPAPDDVKAAIHWIKSLERGIDTKSEKRPIDKEIKFVQCSPCKALEKSTKAVTRCDDCKEPFCASCSVIRHTHPSLKQHTLVNIEDSNETYGEAGEIFNTLCKLMECSEHPGNLITFYCNDDEAYACEACVTTKHKDCKDVVKANTVDVDEETIQERIEMLESSAEHLSEYANTAIEERKASVTAITKQVDEIANLLRDILDNIHRLLKVFEESAVKSASLAARKRTTAINEQISNLADTKRISALYMQLLERLLYAQPLCQVDIVTKTMTERLKIFEREAVEISSNFTESVLGLKEELHLRKLPSEINDIIHGKATIEEQECASDIPKYKSQLLPEYYRFGKVKEISMDERNNYNIVEYLRNGTIVLVDENGTCVMVKHTGEISPTLTLTSKRLNSICTGKDPKSNIFQRASKKDNIVAIPLAMENKIVLVSADDELEIEYVAVTMYQPKALHVMKNGDIAVAWNNPVAFGVISVEGSFVQTKTYFRKDKTGRQMKSFDYIAIDEQRSHVIQPCSYDNAVYCFGFDGDQKFKCDHISTPKGVALDADGNIYTFSCTDVRTGHLFLISPTGLQLRTFSSIVNPRAISIKKGSDQIQMVVTGVNSNIVKIYTYK